MKLSTPLIAFGGHLRAGKDAAADRLVADHGFIKLGMSDALHEAMLAIDPIIQVTAPDDSPVAIIKELRVRRYSEVVASIGYVEAKKKQEVRRLLQNLGTEVGRNMMGEGVWVNIMARKVDDYRGTGYPVAVTGIRFPNEVQMIRDLGGLSVWVDRPGLDTGSAGAHASENSVSGDDFDVTLVNDGSLEDLHQKVEQLLDGK